MRSYGFIVDPAPQTIVNPAPPAKYLVTVQGSSTVQAGTPFQVTVQDVDALGNPVSSSSGPGTVMASLSPSSGAPQASGETQ